MRAREFMQEIDYTPLQLNLSIPSSDVVSGSKLVGEIDGRDVYVYRKGEQCCYFFNNDNDIDALILVVDGKLRGVRNFIGIPGAITALIGFYVHKLNKPLAIDASEQFSSDGINWLCKLIKAGGRGLKLTDQTGNYPDADEVYAEWQKAMRSDMPGKTSIVIESNVKRKLYNRDELLLIPTMWLHESDEAYDRLAEMRNNDVLLEYNRQVTANQVGDKIIASLATDRSLDEIPSTLLQWATNYAALNGMPVGDKIYPDRLEAIKQNADKVNSRKQEIIDNILSLIEQHDPTPNKMYTPWLAKMYAKGGVKIEDLNRYDLLRYFDIGKKRKLIKPEHADINRFKTYDQFEDVMRTQYDLDEIIPPEGGKTEGSASKVYEDSEVLIVVPHDEPAACKYGRGTRWCTAATKGVNYFDQYNSQGKLYILIPKNPQHEGEKYQLHFQSGSYMDEDDSPLPLMDILARFPGIDEYFKSNEPAIQDMIIFTPDNVLQEVINSVADLAQTFIWETISDWEAQDDYYFKFLRDEGFVDEDGEVDWDRAPSYTEYNENASDYETTLTELTQPSVGEVRKWMDDEELTDNERFQNVSDYEMLLSNAIDQHYSRDRRNHDGGLASYIRTKIRVTKTAGEDGQTKYVINTIQG